MNCVPSVRTMSIHLHFFARYDRLYGFVDSIIWGVPSSDILAVGSTVLAPLGGQFGNLWDPTSEHRL